MTLALGNLLKVAEGAAQSFDKKMRAQNWTDAGRESARADALIEVETRLNQTAEGAVVGARDHLRQVESVLTDVAPPDPLMASEIRNELREMSPAERNSFLSQTADPNIIGGVLHWPSSLPLANADVLQRMLTNYNRTHRKHSSSNWRNHFGYRSTRSATIATCCCAGCARF